MASYFFFMEYTLCFRLQSLLLHYNGRDLRLRRTGDEDGLRKQNERYWNKEGTKITEHVERKTIQVL